MKKLILACLLIAATPSFCPIPNCEELTLEEKIAQLIMIAAVAEPADLDQAFVAACPYNLNPSYRDNLISECGVGGVIFFGAKNPTKQAAAIKKAQSNAKSPLLIGLDAEWGLNMRHQEDTVVFPKFMTLGAIAPEHDQLITDVGYEIGRQCKTMGVHINFAPVVDVNNNPKNPIINVRSFGERPNDVAHKSELFMRGMQAAGALASAKHFPGHGDVDADSHHGLVQLSHDRARLDAVELVPFKQLIKDGVAAVMTAHLLVTALKDEDELVPATLSPTVLTKLLREDLGFKGLIITDGLGMKGVTDMFEPGELELKAFKAGNDILLCPPDPEKAIKRIAQAVKDGEISETVIDERVERILAAKRKVIATDTATQEFDPASVVTPEAQLLKAQLYQAAVTVPRDRCQTVPLPKDKKYILLSFGESEPFVEALSADRDIEYYRPEEQAVPAKTLDDAEQLLVSVHLKGRSGMIEMSGNTSLEAQTTLRSLVNKYGSKVTLALFGNPYNLSQFPEVGTVVVGYENEPEAQQAVANVLLGTHAATGTLPVTPPNFEL